MRKKYIVGKRSKKKHTTQPHTWRNTPHRYKNSEDTQPHNSYGQQDFQPPTHHRSRYTHHTHVTMTVMILTTQQSPTKLSSKSPTHPQNVFTVIFFLLFLFLIENENRVFSFEVGKVNVTLRIKRS